MGCAPGKVTHKGDPVSPWGPEQAIAVCTVIGKQSSSESGIPIRFVSSRVGVIASGVNVFSRSVTLLKIVRPNRDVCSKGSECSSLMAEELKEFFKVYYYIIINRYYLI